MTDLGHRVILLFQPCILIPIIYYTDLPLNLRASLLMFKGIYISPIFQADLVFVSESRWHFMSDSGCSFLFRASSVCQEDWVDFHRQLIHEHGAQYKAGFMSPWRGGRANPKLTVHLQIIQNKYNEAQSSFIYKLY